MRPRLRLHLHEHAVVAHTHHNSLSRRTPHTPMPMEINPRKVFERMFGQGGSAADRLARTEEDKSVLDAIAKQIAGLQRRLGPKDRTAVSDYLESVREIE